MEGLHKNKRKRPGIYTNTTVIPGLASIPIKLGPLRSHTVLKTCKVTWIGNRKSTERRRRASQLINRLLRSCGKAQRAKRPLLFSDQNMTSKEEESPSLSINPSFFEEPKFLEVVVGLNLSSGPREKDITDQKLLESCCY